MWPVMTFYTNSAIHMLAHSAWAQALMVMGAAELGLARGKLHSRWWKLATPVALAVSGVAFLVHEQNDWFFARSAFLHHLLGWTLVLGALVPLGARLPAALGRAPVRLRDRADRARGDALLRPRRGADLRPPLAARGGAAPVRRLALAGLVVALCVPAAAWAHASLDERLARLPAAARARRRRSSACTSTRSSTCRRSRCSTTRAATTPGTARVRRDGRRRDRARAADGRRTRSAGTRSRPTRTSSRASGRSACA